MKRIRRIAFLLCASLLAGALLAGCENQPAEEPLPPQPDYVPRYWLKWDMNGETGPRRPDGSLTAWNWLPAMESKVNKMHIIYYPEDENGDVIVGVPDIPSLEKKIAQCDYELQQSHDAGIRIIAYSSDVQVHINSIERQGLSVEDIAAVRDGAKVHDMIYMGEDGYIACISSPVWRQWMKDVLRAYATAGYDGLMYDYGFYAAAGWFCECKYCREGWAKHSAEKFGKELPHPSADGFDVSTEENREYVRYKIAEGIDFLKQTSAGAFEVNPDFEFVMNQNAFSITFAYEALAGAWNGASSEFATCKLGRQTTFYLNKLTEALGYSELNSIVNTPSQVEVPGQYPIALAESYAGIGGMTFPTAYEGEVYERVTQMFRFTAEHPEIFASTKSQAKVAMLYSAESEIFSQAQGQFSDLPEKEGSRSRMASDTMTEAGIDHDIIVLEKEDALDRLNGYDAVVIPQYTYFADETWQPVLKALAESGKRVVIFALNENNAVVKYVLPVLDGAEVPNHVIPYDYSNPADLRGAFEGTEAENVLTFENDADLSEGTVRSYDKKTYYIHLIRRMVKDVDYTECSQVFTYRLPAGKSVKEVKAYCPFAENTDVSAEYTEKDGFVTVTTGNYYAYCIVALTLD